jgi:catechol 2,3-dioxygenase-like lactoylglutathione lyase family enzyme
MEGYMSKVTGIGGIFFACKNVEATRAWYRDVLGLTLNDHGGADFLHEASVKAHEDGARTIWAPFESAEYFQPGTGQFMINLMVDDLAGMIARIQAAGVELVGAPETYPYGKFAWVLDPDDRKLELWEPIPSSKVSS